MHFVSSQSLIWYKSVFTKGPCCTTRFELTQFIVPFIRKVATSGKYNWFSLPSVTQLFAATHIVVKTSQQWIIYGLPGGFLRHSLLSSGMQSTLNRSSSPRALHFLRSCNTAVRRQCPMILSERSMMFWLGNRASRHVDGDALFEHLLESLF